MRKSLGKDIGLGAIAGIAGTGLMQGMLAGSRKFAPQTLPPMKDDPGNFMVEQAEKLLPEPAQEKIPSSAEKAAAMALAFGYGTTFTMLYAGLPRRQRRILMDGAALGGLTWAVGYLGWLPVAKLMPPIWKQEPKQVVPNIFSHLLFGIATVGLFNWLRKKI
jgi:uncharacterized membrane protein YagU involved in acid resistance